jgi:GTP:adenosylcobinamide-phosphate guanylyltransferase
MEAGVDTMPDRRYTAIIMAGSRRGLDPMASAAGVSHKCLVEVAGQAMLERVLETIDACPWVARSVLCVEGSFDAPAFVRSRIDRGTLTRLDAAGSPAASATRACEQFAIEMPLLVVTADHPLLDGAMLDYFCARAGTSGDVAVAVAPASIVLGRYPDATRTLLKFSDGPYCGCNLFALNTPAAATVTRFWMRIEAQRKNPWRIVRLLGVRPLMAYVAGRLPLGYALDVISVKLGVRAGAVSLPFAQAAIDVDKPADLALVRSILENSGGSP